MNFRLFRSTIKVHDIYSGCDLHPMLWCDGVWVVLSFAAKDPMFNLQGIHFCTQSVMSIDRVMYRCSVLSVQ